MTSQNKKCCPSCHQFDVTDFNTCRYCHARYDATAKPKSESSMGGQLVTPVVIVLAILGITAFFVQTERADHAAKMAEIQAEIKSAGHPRVVEFYATWCGPCHSYEPAVLDCSRHYAGKVDFQRLDIDSPANKKMVTAMGVHSVPTTCIFNQDGEEVFHQSGALPEEMLDHAVQKVVR
jgi:thiol-disulfide isomerase/thioredoxin